MKKKTFLLNASVLSVASIIGTTINASQKFDLLKNKENNRSKKNNYSQSFITKNNNNLSSFTNLIFSNNQPKINNEIIFDNSFSDILKNADFNVTKTSFYNELKKENETTKKSYQTSLENLEIATYNRYSGSLDSITTNINVFKKAPYVLNFSNFEANKSLIDKSINTTINIKQTPVSKSFFNFEDKTFDDVFEFNNFNETNRFRNDLFTIVDYKFDIKTKLNPIFNPNQNKTINNQNSNLGSTLNFKKNFTLENENIANITKFSSIINFNLDKFVKFNFGYNNSNKLNSINLEFKKEPLILIYKLFEMSKNINKSISDINAITNDATKLGFDSNFISDTKNWHIPWIVVSQIFKNIKIEINYVDGTKNKTHIIWNKDKFIPINLDESTNEINIKSIKYFLDTNNLQQKVDNNIFKYVSESDLKNKAISFNNNEIFVKTDFNLIKKINNVLDQKDNFTVNLNLDKYVLNLIDENNNFVINEKPIVLNSFNKLFDIGYNRFLAQKIYGINDFSNSLVTNFQEAKNILNLESKPSNISNRFGFIVEIENWNNQDNSNSFLNRTYSNDFKQKFLSNKFIVELKNKNNQDKNGYFLVAANTNKFDTKIPHFNYIDKSISDSLLSDPNSVLSVFNTEENWKIINSYLENIDNVVAKNSKSFLNENKTLDFSYTNEMVLTSVENFGGKFGLTINENEENLIQKFLKNLYSMPMNLTDDSNKGIFVSKFNDRYFLNKNYRLDFFANDDNISYSITLKNIDQTNLTYKITGEQFKKLLKNYYGSTDSPYNAEYNKMAASYDNQVTKLGQKILDKKNLNNEKKDNLSKQEKQLAIGSETPLQTIVPTFISISVVVLAIVILILILNRRRNAFKVKNSKKIKNF